MYDYLNNILGEGREALVVQSYLRNCFILYICVLFWVITEDGTLCRISSNGEDNKVGLYQLKSRHEMKQLQQQQYKDQYMYACIYTYYICFT